jgi:transcription elongation factor S-II
MPSIESDIYDMKKALEKALKDENMKTAKNVLKELYKIRVTASLLQKTQIGKLVNHVKKYQNVSEDVVKLSKRIINNWKQDVQEDIKEKQKSETTKKPLSRSSSHDSLPKVSSNVQKSEKSEKPEKPDVKRTSATDGVRLMSTGDKARDGCAKMIYKALALYEGASPQVVSKKASQIESEVFKIYNGVDNQYKSKIRSLYLNLKDKTNPHLREKIINDVISPAQFCNMSATEMASEEKREEIKKIQDHNLFLARGAESQEAETDQFKCGKCKSRKCKYYQMQTRSADEVSYMIYILR